MVGVLEGQTYIVSGYLAVLAALLILAGALSDRYGRRRVYSIGLAGFALTSGLCGLAPTLEALVVFRLLQGAAGSLMVPVRCRAIVLSLLLGSVPYCSSNIMEGSGS